MDMPSGLECRFCREPDVDWQHIVDCARAPWHRQPGWQVAIATPSRWLLFRAWLANKLRRR